MKGCELIRGGMGTEGTNHYLNFLVHYRGLAGQYSDCGQGTISY
jgi:hypothetical protein